MINKTLIALLKCLHVQVHFSNILDQQILSMLTGLPMVVNR